MWQNIPIIYDLIRPLILPIEKIDNALPKEGKIYDLGCGQGVISEYLSKSGRSVIGIDSSSKCLPKSQKENLKFVQGDITKVNFRDPSGFVISDVLHHLDYQAQKDLCKKIFKSLKPGGVLAIKEIDTNEFLRSRLSRFWDFVFYPKDKIYYWSSTELIKFLRGLGFSVKMERTSHFFPGSTSLFTCTK